MHLSTLSQKDSFWAWIWNLHTIFCRNFAQLFSFEHDSKLSPEDLCKRIAFHHSQAPHISLMSLYHTFKCSDRSYFFPFSFLSSVENHQDHLMTSLWLFRGKPELFATDLYWLRSDLDRLERHSKHLPRCLTKQSVAHFTRFDFFDCSRGDWRRWIGRLRWWQSRWKSWKCGIFQVR